MHCYRCGRPLREDERHPRRKVPTGGWTSRTYPGPKVGAAKSRYGLRVVCGRCARVLDLSEGRIQALENAKLAIALVVLVGLTIYWLSR
jgi:hypothetical protein